MTLTLGPLDHAALAVTNLDRSIAWYRDVLGLKRKYAEFFDEPVMLCSGGACVALFQAETVAAFRPRREREPGILHFAFRVDSQNFAAAIEQLAALGIEARHEDHSVERSIYFDDPDGNELQMMLFVPDHDPDARPV